MSRLITIDKKTKMDGLSCNNVYGSYVHGIFDNEDVLVEIAKALLHKKGLSYKHREKFDIKVFKEIEYNKLADELRNVLDMDTIYRILNEGVLQ